ncbi:uncharacterized protein LOC135811633 [Sycon ciliatum]|uniref:uncharacterized protein LOC135811633 n=1 Tax=Sycon ciliatum TaxID=27933 RepID=UPI0031F6A084
MAFVLLQMLVLPFFATIMAAPLPQGNDHGDGNDARVVVLKSRPTRHFVRASHGDQMFHANMKKCTDKAWFNFRPTLLNGENVHTIQNNHSGLYWSAENQDTLRAANKVSLDASEDAAAFFIIHTDANANLEFESVKYRGQYVAVLTTAHSHSRLVLKTKSQLRLNDPTVGFLYSYHHSQHMCASTKDHDSHTDKNPIQKHNDPVSNPDRSNDVVKDYLREALLNRRQSKKTVKVHHEIRTAAPQTTSIPTTQPVEDTGELTDAELFALLGWF